MSVSRDRLDETPDFMSVHHSCANTGVGQWR
jgi:hypothetical protein